MKRFSLLITFLALSLWAMADGPDSQYVAIYSMIQEADRLKSSGQNRLAQEKYGEAQKLLKKLQTSYPNWKENMVQFRLNYLADRIAIEKSMPQEGDKARPADRVVGPKVSETKPAPSEPPGVIQTQQSHTDALVQEVRRLQAEKAVLEAKLREALTAQPAAVDPRELAKAEEKIRALEMEREVLKAALEKEKSHAGAEAQVSALEELRRALAEANEKLQEQTDRAIALAREKEILETRLQSLRKSDQTLASLQSENEALKQQVAELSTKATAAAVLSQPDKPGGDAVTELRSALATLQAEKAALEKTKSDLEKKLTEAPALPVKPTPAEAEKVKQLERDRDELQRKLNETSKALYENKARTVSIQQKRYDDELSTLRSRLEVLEAKKAPYTPDELALFKQPSVAPAVSEAKEVKEVNDAQQSVPPKGAASLVAEAERAFKSGRFDEAEQKYLQVLSLDDKNVFTLSNLAASQLEQNRLSEAETSLKKALAQNPNDSHCLLLMGILHFRQEKLDQALDMLSRSAQVDPTNPETHNYLGITLSQKGQRGPAETALRRAVQLAPGYGGAHHNLAIVYATQQPPFMELARWHYQKALQAGHPQNPELEKLLDRNRSSDK